MIVFAGTETKLYHLNIGFHMDRCFQIGRHLYGVVVGCTVAICADGNLVFATQKNAPLQVFDLSSSTAFADAGKPAASCVYRRGGPVPCAKRASVCPCIGIQWSGLNSFNGSQSWTAGVNSSDYQDFPDGGIVRGVAGGEFGLHLSGSGDPPHDVRSGSPLAFQIDRIAQDMGLFAPYSIIRAGELVFFIRAGLYQIALAACRADRAREG